MIKQTIQTFYDVKDGVVKLGHTSPIFSPLVEKNNAIRKRGNSDAESRIEPGTEKKK